jgi:hypothetical protein
MSAAFFVKKADNYRCCRKIIMRIARFWAVESVFLIFVEKVLQFWVLGLLSTT